MRLLILTDGDPMVARAAEIARSRDSDVELLAADSVQGGDAVPPADMIWAPVLEHSGTEKRFRDLASWFPTAALYAYGVAVEARFAVAAIRGGAEDFLPLPPDADLIAAVLAAVAGAGGSEVVSASPAMHEVLALARRVAPSKASVMISGESGTGKEVLARFIHAHSDRADGPFVSLNCAAVPEHLLESELFGHEKGAFTGALARRIGKFEEADGGTLLLDEVTEMDPRLQAKLLRVLQERVVDRIGGKEPIAIDIRVLATTNRDLAAAVADGHFREDLQYRLKVIDLKLPALRDRAEDIEPLARYFVERFARSGCCQDLSPAALAVLRAHSWPGNVRELENCLYRASLLSDGDIEPEHLGLGAPMTSRREPSVATASDEGAPGDALETLADSERRLIFRTLEHTGGNRTRAAELLGISIRTLRNRLREYLDQGLNPPSAAGPGTAPHLSGGY